MFNSLQVSNAIEQQVPSYLSNEYPNFINFFKDYYRFLETNGNALDILNGITDLIDIDTYTAADAQTTLDGAITASDTSITVLGHVDFPLNNGLLKIDSEVIFYKRKQSITDGGVDKTVFNECSRGWTYNTLSVENGFKANNVTVAESHSDASIVLNQSYNYVLYFLEQIREQYLIDFPKNVLLDNLDLVNVDFLLKKAKDFYLAKGTPQGIDYYFKFLFQEKPELKNYNESLIDASNATYQSKEIVRIEALDDYDTRSLDGDCLIQGSNEFPVQTVENTFSTSSQVYEVELSNGSLLNPTRFTKITSTLIDDKLFVDSTYEFPTKGFLRIGQQLVEYTEKTLNYFKVKDFNSTKYKIGQVIYDFDSLTTVKTRPDIFFVIYAGVSGFSIDSTLTSYQVGDIGQVKDIIEVNDKIINSWYFNDLIPCTTRNGFLSGVNTVWYNDLSAYVYTSSIPFYETFSIPPNVLLEDGKYIRQFPRTFQRSPEGSKQNIPINEPVGFLRDGTAILSWKSAITFTRGKIESIDIESGGDHFNVNNPPAIRIDVPRGDIGEDLTLAPTSGATGFEGIRAEAELIVNGSLKEIFIEKRGLGYPKNIVIDVVKDPTDTEFTGNDFSPAIVQPIVVAGAITKIRIIDAGKGYTKQPTVRVTPVLGEQAGVTENAILSAFVTGAITKVNVTEPGRRYKQDPTYELIKGTSATGFVTISNGRIIDATVINGGNNYNSPPIITIKDNAQTGSGGVIVPKLSAGSITELKVINSGINYSDLGVTLSIAEPGSGDILLPNATKWNLINNFDQNQIEFYDNDSGLFLTGDRVIQEDGETKIAKTLTALGPPRNLQLKIDGVVTSINFNDPTVHSPIIGWALDGAPIYGPYGYRNALKADNTQIKKMESGYNTLTATEHSSNNNAIRNNSATYDGLGIYGYGSFAEDYVWSAAGSDLDEQNGRFCVTPEYPDGVYAYFMTFDLSINNIIESGFPFFVGPKFAGVTYQDFNDLEVVNIDAITGVKRYVTADSTSVSKSIDRGAFSIKSVPTSALASLDSIDIVSGGDGYKIGDVVKFDNSGTSGFGAGGFVSVLSGKLVSSVTATQYDYLEYYDEAQHFVSGITIKNGSGFQATVHSIDQLTRRMYLSNVTGTPTINDEIFDTSLAVDNSKVSELSGDDINGISVGANVVTALLTQNISSVDTYFSVGSFNNGTISDLYSNSQVKYIKIDDEYMKVVKLGTGHIFVNRGQSGTLAASHTTNSAITLIDAIEVFDSSPFIVGDVIQINSENATIVDIQITKEENFVRTRIVDGTGTQSGTQYYLYFNQILQSLTGGAPNPNAAVVDLDGDSNIQDLVFDQGTFDASPIAEIVAGVTTYDPTAVVSENINIQTSTYKHLLIVERGTFETTVGQHYPRTTVSRLGRVFAKVGKYEENRILTKINAQNNGLTISDNVTIKAATAQVENINLTLSGTTFSAGNFTLTNGNYFKTLYEGSTYKYTKNNNSDSYLISFFTPGASGKQKEYFDVNVSKEINPQTNELLSFTIRPDSSDLTEYVLRFTNLTDPNIIDVHVSTLPEPVNGEYKVVNSSTSDFEIYTPEDPSAFLSGYNGNTFRYTTISPNASGPIEVATMTSGGFDYDILPGISGVTSDTGVNAILEPKSDSVGTIQTVQAISSGYGYNPASDNKPKLRFPQISKISQNFVVTDVTVTDPGEGYVFTPRVVVSGGGLPVGDPSHVRLSPTVVNGQLLDLDITFEGIRYSSAPTLDIEKYYFATLNTSGDLQFKFNFKEYFRDDDSYRIRAYYQDTVDQQIKFVESGIFFAFIDTITMKNRYTSNGTDYVDPTSSNAVSSGGAFDKAIVMPAGQSVLYYQVILLERKATAVVSIKKSTFITNEKVIIGQSPTNITDQYFGFIATNQGWQPNSSIVRLENSNKEVEVGNVLVGVNSGAYGFVDEAYAATTEVILDSVVETPKQFLDTKSHLGFGVYKIQDSLRYQKFAYEISSQTPFLTWKEGYQRAAHPAGYRIFANTEIKNSSKETISASTTLKVSTDVNSIVRMNQKYNYFVSRNKGFDEVNILNKLLTDVKDIKTSVVAVFDDISDQFDGVKTAFELKAVNPTNPTDAVTGDINYIEGYNVDQMVIILDNIVQTYGTSWIITDSDKTLDFTESVKDNGELMPANETLTYRQFNEDMVIHNHSTTQTTALSAGSPIQLVDIDSNPFPSSIYTSIDEDKWLVLIDGVCQLKSSFAVASSNNGEISFTQDLEGGSQINVRFLNGFLKNEFTNGTVIASQAILISQKPSLPTSKESYFIWVDGVLQSTDDYEVDASKDIVFDYGFSYESLVVMIDPLGVSLETSTHGIINNQYSYKIEDGQLVIPTGTVINSKEYLVDIAGVVQTPDIAYKTITSGVRKINFFEAPQRFVGSDNTVGRQFVGILYRRRGIGDQTIINGQSITPPDPKNYQFDDVSKNVVMVKQDPIDFVVGDYVVTSTSSGRIARVVREANRKIVNTGLVSTVVANNATFNLTLADIIGINVGDRVKYNASIGLTSPDDDELEITAIDNDPNSGTYLQVTFTNISGGNLTIEVLDLSGIRINHFELWLEELETTNANRDLAFASSDILESGVVSAIETTTNTLLNEPFGVLTNETVFTVADATGITTNDYLVLDNYEVVKVTNVSTNDLTVTRAQLTSSNDRVFANNTTVEKIIPRNLTVSNFYRGFDGDKKIFELKKDGERVNINTGVDLFIIINGILQKRGPSYTLQSIDPTPSNPSSGDEYTVIEFTEAPEDGVSFNSFYVGELEAIQDMSPFFNGIDTVFDLRSSNGEIFSLIHKAKPETNISANLLLFIDGVLQIPSSKQFGRPQAYPDLITAFNLLGSVVEFTSTPRAGSDFEGYIFVGSPNDFDSIDIDAIVESDDVIIQSNEVEPRIINNVTSSTTLSVDDSAGEVLGAKSINAEPNGTDWFKADLLKKARIRESLRARRTLTTTVNGFGSSNSPYPLTGKVLYTTPITRLTLNNISEDLPPSPDSDNNEFTLILPATTNFGIRKINCKYTQFVPRTSSTVDELQGIQIGHDITFDQIVKLNATAAGETFLSSTAGGTNGDGSIETIDSTTITYDTTRTASLVRWDQTNRLLYVKLNDTAFPITTSSTINSHAVDDDDLINEYQTVATHIFDATSGSVVNTTDNTITIANHGFVQGDVISYTSDGGTAIGGLTDATQYHVEKIDDNTIKLAESKDDLESDNFISLTSGAAGTEHLLLKVGFIYNF